MERTARPIVSWLLIVTLALAIPIVPFVVLGERFEQHVLGWFDASISPVHFTLLTIGVLAVDVLLPVPSSFVNTLAGARLGIAAATLACWLGMMLGSAAAFALARTCGRPLVHRWTRSGDRDQLNRLAQRHGTYLIVLTRALPVLAEATVLVLGSVGVSWRSLAWPLVLANLGLALAYAVLGAYAVAFGQLPLALAASIALPLIATLVVRRRRVPESRPTEPRPSGRG